MARVSREAWNLRSNGEFEFERFFVQLSLSLFSSLPALSLSLLSSVSLTCVVFVCICVWAREITVFFS